MTPAGIETATFRFLAQHLNHCATAYCTIYRESVCVLHIFERHCVCIAQSREALCVCVLHRLERHCVCTAQCRVTVCVLHSPEWHCVCVLHILER